MTSDVILQIVIQGGALAILAVLILVVGPKMVTRWLSQNSKDNQTIVYELRKVRKQTHRTNNLLVVLLGKLADDTKDPEIRNAMKRHMLKAAIEDEDDEDEGEGERKARVSVVRG